MQSPTALPAADVAAVARVAQDEDAAVVAELAHGSTALVRGCDTDNEPRAVAARADPDAWLTRVITSGVRAMGTFAAGLEKDGDAVRAVLTMPWSNGQN